MAPVLTECTDVAMSLNFHIPLTALRARRAESGKHGKSCLRVPEETTFLQLI